MTQEAKVYLVGDQYWAHKGSVEELSTLLSTLVTTGSLPAPKPTLLNEHKMITMAFKTTHCGEPCRQTFKERLELMVAMEARFPILFAEVF